MRQTSERQLQDAVGIIDNLCHQIEQMRGLSDDGDGQIAQALDEARTFARHSRPKFAAPRRAAEWPPQNPKLEEAGPVLPLHIRPVVFFCFLSVFFRHKSAAAIFIFPPLVSSNIHFNNTK